MKSIRKQHSLKPIAMTSTIAMGAILSSCGPQTAAPVGVYNDDARLVFPQTTQPITIDGIGPVAGANGDAAWTDDSVKFELEQGAPNPAAVMRVVANADDLFIYAQAEDVAYDADDQFVITLNPDGDDLNYHRFTVAPCPSGGAACPGSGGAVVGGITPSVTYATGELNGTHVTWTNTSVPGALDFETMSNVSQNGSNNIWSVEMRIKRTALGGFNEDWMGLFANTLVTDATDPGSPSIVQYSWPTGLAITNTLFGAGDLDYPAVADWGNSTLSTAFGNGVSVAFNEFGSNQADPSVIALDEPNSFHAYAINNQSTAGTLVAADDVSATFEIANFGLGIGWANVPGSNNPAGPANIPAAGAHLFETGTWNLTAAEIADYSANPHQCVKVTLTTTNANTVIAQAVTQRNMNFQTVNSPFEEMGSVGLGQFAELATKERGKLVLRESFLNLPKGMEWETQLKGASQVGKRSWMVPFRQTSAQELGIWVSPDDRLKIPSELVTLKPDSDEEVSFGVTPGNTLTLIADGFVTIGEMTVSGGGASSGVLERNKVSVQERGELRKGRPDRYGLIIGSFDGFKTSFPVGNGTTLIVPDGAQKMSLMINDGAKGAALRKGDGFSVQLISTPTTADMIRTFPELSRRGGKEGQPIFAPLGANLPTWVVRGQVVTDRYITIGDTKYRIHMPGDSMGSWIRSVGPVGGFARR